MQGLPHDENLDQVGELGFDFTSLMSSIGKGVVTGAKAVGSAAKKYAPDVIDIGTQLAQARMQQRMLNAQTKTQNIQSQQAVDAQPAVTPADKRFLPQVPAPYAQPQSQAGSFLTQRVAGVPVWVLGVGIVGVIAGIRLWKKRK